MLFFRSVDRLLTKAHEYFFKEKVTGKEKLRQSDILRLYVLTRLKRQKLNRDGKRAADQFKRILDSTNNENSESDTTQVEEKNQFEEYLPSSEEQKEIVDRNIWEQVMNMFTVLDICARRQPCLPYGTVALLEKPNFEKTIPDPSDLISFALRVKAGDFVAYEKQLMNLGPDNKSLQVVNRQILQHDKRIKQFIPTLDDQKEMEERIQSQLGFIVYKAPSIIPNAGNGLFIKGKVSEGTVVALYPGVVYFPSEWEKIPGYPYVSKYSTYLVKRQDGVIIDGKPLEQNEVNDQEGELSTVAWDRINPFALGQYANHPPKGTEPNIISYSIDYPLYRMPSHMKALIPNRYISDEDNGAWSSAMNKMEDVVEFGRDRKTRVMRSMVLITLKEVENEELFINYRYNPLHPIQTGIGIHLQK
eukprot:jgi/Galph1/5772/GphlegSOOS_G4330.1